MNFDNRDQEERDREERLDLYVRKQDLASMKDDQIRDRVLPEKGYERAARRAMEEYWLTETYYEKAHATVGAEKVGHQATMAFHARWWVRWLLISYKKARGQ